MAKMPRIHGHDKEIVLNVRNSNPPMTWSKPLAYAMKGQMTVRNQAHGGKTPIKMATGINPVANQSHLHSKGGYGRQHPGKTHNDRG